MGRVSQQVPIAHDKVQRLPKFNEFKEPLKDDKMNNNKMRNNRLGNLFSGKIMDSQNNSCSSINFESSEEYNEDNRKIIQPSTPQEKYDQFNNDSRLLTSKFLDFSCLHPRKTRKEILNEISFESDVHNIYNPIYDSSTSSTPTQSPIKPQIPLKLPQNPSSSSAPKVQPVSVGPHLICKRYL